MRPLLLCTIMVSGAAAQGSDPVDHARFGVILDQVWHDGLVDYGAAREHHADLDAYIATLGLVPRTELDAMSREVKLAFWINAYNACAMSLVLDHYPIQRRGGVGRVVNAVKGIPANSIQQIPNTWSRKFCPVAGADRSLDEIEHEIVRPMGEPRIHFAINCAARSCPRLAPEPYLGATLHEQLDAAVRHFISDDRHFSFEDGRRPRIHVNKVLDWFKEDFGGVDGVAEFFLPYLTEAQRRQVAEGGGLRVTFRDYDWTLNDTAVFGNTR